MLCDNTNMNNHHCFYNAAINILLIYLVCHSEHYRHHRASLQ